MKFQRVQKKITRTAEDLARIKAVREKFQRERPTVDELLQSGEYTQTVSLGWYLRLKALLHDLKKAREAAGLSLSALAECTGMDKAALSRLENGRQPNPTLDTICRYATAVGKELTLALADPDRAQGDEKKAQG